MLFLAGVEPLRRGLGVELKQRGHRIGRRQRAHLFDDEGQQYGEKSHATRRAIRKFGILL
jgi:hypothetical protein